MRFNNIHIVRLARYTGRIASGISAMLLCACPMVPAQEEVRSTTHPSPDGQLVLTVMQRSRGAFGPDTIEIDLRRASDPAPKRGGNVFRGYRPGAMAPRWHGNEHLVIYISPETRWLYSATNCAGVGIELRKLEPWQHDEDLR